jgi:hypothetical protein
MLHQQVILFKNIKILVLSILMTFGEALAYVYSGQYGPVS